MHFVAALALAATAGHADPASSPDPTSFAASADIRARVAAMARAMKPGQGFRAEPLVQGDGSVAALEYWKAPGNPAVHPAETEYATVIAGAGTLVSGGTLVAPRRRSAGLVEGDRIENGTTRALGPGDVFLIPAGTPHWFGIDGRLVLLGIKIGTGAATDAATRPDPAAAGNSACPSAPRQRVAITTATTPSGSYGPVPPGCGCRR